MAPYVEDLWILIPTHYSKFCFCGHTIYSTSARYTEGTSDILKNLRFFNFYQIWSFSRVAPVSVVIPPIGSYLPGSGGPCFGPISPPYSLVKPSKRKSSQEHMITECCSPLPPPNVAPLLQGTVLWLVDTHPMPCLLPNHCKSLLRIDERLDIYNLVIGLPGQQPLPHVCTIRTTQVLPSIFLAVAPKSNATPNSIPYSNTNSL